MKKIYIKEEKTIEEELINARKLKKILENKSNFLTWIKKHIEINNLKENDDYFIEKNQIYTLKKIKKEKINYFLTYEACIKIISSQSRNLISKKIIRQLEEGIKLNQIMEELSTKNEKITIIKFEDKEYPEQLKKIKDPPQQLYVKGNIENLKEHGIAVIGSRDCSNYGRTICRIFTKNLVGYNL